MRKRELFELRTKKRSSEIFAWIMRNLFEKSEIFRFESKISWTGCTTLQDPKRIDAALSRIMYELELIVA